MRVQLGGAIALLTAVALGGLASLGLAAAPSARADDITPVTLDQPTAGEVVYSDSASVFAAVFAGLGAFGDRITVTGPGGDTFCEGSVQDDGTWSCTAPTMPDFFGDVAVTDSVTTVVRMLGAVNPPRFDPGQVAGISTDDSGFVTSGTAAPGASVAVLADGEPACTTLADGVGAWSCALALSDSDVGTTVLTATQTPPYAPSASATSPPTALMYQLPVIVVPVIPMNPVDPGDPSDPIDPGTPADPGTPEVPPAPANPTPPGDATPAAPSAAAEAEPATAHAAASATAPTSSAPAGSGPTDSTGVFSVDPLPGSSARDQETAPTAQHSAENGRSGVDNAPTHSSAGSAAASTARAPLSAAPAQTAPSPLTASGWNDPSHFGTSLRPLGAIPFGSPAFIVSVLLLAAGFLLLLALPAELLQSTIRENYHRIAPRLTRLTRFTRFTRTTPFARLLPRRPARASSDRRAPTGALAALTILLLTAAVSAFADPSTGLDPRSLRLMLALALVMIVVNGVGILSSGLLASRLHRVTTAVSARPLTLLLVAATVAVSRVADLQPGLLFGLVLGVEFGTRLRGRQVARITIVTSCALLVLGLASWLTFSLIEPARQSHPDFADRLAAEVLTGVTVETITGLAIALLPLAFLDGNAIFAVSKRAWALLYAIVLAVFAVVILPLPSSWVELPSLVSPWAIGSGVFALISVVTWAAFRFTRPRAERTGHAEPESADTRELSR